MQALRYAARVGHEREVPLAGLVDPALEGGELLQVRPVAAHRVGGRILLVLELADKVGDVLPHADTLTYRTGFCKRRGLIKRGMRSAERKLSMPV